MSDWVKFYENEYTYIGKVIGNFYDKDGNETLALKDFYVKLKRGTDAKEQDNMDKKTFPECNSKWSKEEGTEVWCTNERYISHFSHDLKLESSFHELYFFTLMLI